MVALKTGCLTTKVAVKTSNVEATGGASPGLELPQNSISRELLLFGLTGSSLSSPHWKDLLSDLTQSLLSGKSLFSACLSETISDNCLTSQLVGTKIQVGPNKRLAKIFKREIWEMWLPKMISKSSDFLKKYSWSSWRWHKCTKSHTYPGTTWEDLMSLLWVALILCMQKLKSKVEL